MPPSNIKIANKTKRSTIELIEDRSSEITCSIRNGIPSARIAFSIDGKDVKNGSNDCISLQLKATINFHRKLITCSAHQSFLETPLKDTAVLFVLSEYKNAMFISLCQLFECDFNI